MHGDQNSSPPWRLWLSNSFPTGTTRVSKCICKLITIFCWTRQITIAAFVIEWYGNGGPVFSNLAALASLYSVFLLVLVVSLVSAVSFRSFRWYSWFRLGVPSGLSSFRWLRFVVLGMSKRVTSPDDICPCLKLLPLSNFGSHLRGSQWGNNCVCLRGSNFRIFIRLAFSVSYSLLFLPICLALFLPLPFFLSVACTNKFPYLHLVHWFASTLLALQVGRVIHQETSINLQSTVSRCFCMLLPVPGEPQSPSHCGHAVKHYLQRWHGFLVVDCLLEKVF